MWAVELGLIADWIDQLDESTYAQVVAALKLLETHGPQLGRPLVDTISHSRYRNLKELRPGSSGKSEIRILFAFDPDRRAVMLIAGDKSNNWTKWYSKNILIAEELFESHLATRENHENKKS